MTAGGGGRIRAALDRLASRGERALVAYTMAGYPPGRGALSVFRGIVRGGADVVEVGLPFSDPLADGPVIRDAAAASLRGGTTVDGALAFVRRARKEEPGLPLAIMTYANILHRRGYARFAADAARAGADGLIVPDIPVDESAGYAAAAAAAGLDAVLLAAPNTPPGRLRLLASRSSGFLYLVAVYGTTGAREGGPPEYALRAVRAARRAAGGRIPVGAGFGVSAPGDVARFVGAGADAVIVGSAILRLAGTVPPRRLEDEVASLVRGLKEPTLPRGRRPFPRGPA